MSTAQDSPQTERLLRRALAGDENAVSELLENHRRYLRKVIDLWMEDELRVRVDPSDVVQEAQMAATQRLEEYLMCRPTSFRIWLRGKALDQVVEMRRRHLKAAKRSVRREVAISDQSSLALARGLAAASPSQQLRRKEQAERVRVVVENMHTQDREILLLRHVEELGNAEVAEVLEINPGAASQRYGRAIRRLRERLAEMGMSHGD